jgi:hypothetical protein
MKKLFLEMVFCFNIYEEDRELAKRANAGWVLVAVVYDVRIKATKLYFRKEV